ncbi:MAG: methionine--tRNA ligase [Acidobacteria bacterium]|nr:methionine--tRNA ligase [Acidobacteriota bacterium]
MSNTFYVTTPIYYVNSNPHLGHLYTTIIADSVARFHRQRGKEVFFLTGTDEHGQNIERAAAERGLPVEEHVNRYVEAFQQAFAPYGFTNNHWVRTTHDYHKQAAQELWRRAVANGFIYKDKYEGWYCANCNQFYLESEVVIEAGKPPVCPTHDRPLDKLAEESYFFKLSAFQDKLLKLYEDNPNFIRPEARRNEVLSFVNGGLNDLSVSRTSVKWGIPVPDDPAHTMYVWFDALSNYITAIGFGNEQYGGEPHYQKFWPANLQLVGKDILRFHTVYWPAFLLAAGEPLPQTVFAHGMWLSGGRKMSKTLGNVIDLAVLRKHFTTDAVRYFCLREMSFGQDGDFTYEALVDRTNAELAKGLGNQCNRTLVMLQNYFGGQVPAAPLEADVEEELWIRAQAVRAIVTHAVGEFDLNFNSYYFSDAIEEVVNAVRTVDKFISDKEPWKLAKNPEQRNALALVLNTAIEAVRHFAVLLAPVLPNSSQAMWQQLGETGEVAAVNPATLAWGQAANKTLGEIAPIFPTLDKGKVMEEIKQEEAPIQPAAAAPAVVAEAAPAVEAPAPVAEPTYIGIDDFTKVELRVGQILTADPVPKADKLLRFTIDLGEAEPRQILAGIAQYYEYEKLIGRKVIVVANLAPRKLRGFESQGMILAASVGDEGKPVLAGFLEEVPNGAKLR